MLAWILININQIQFDLIEAVGYLLIQCIESIIYS